jgi:hypothetical protein
MTDEPNITVHTYATQIPVSAEFARRMEADRALNDAIMAGFIEAMRPKTGDELRQQEARNAEREAKRIREWEANIARHAAAAGNLATVGNPYATRLAAVLDDHGPNGYGDCGTCGTDEWSEDWPCATWLAATGGDA